MLVEDVMKKIDYIDNKLKKSPLFDKEEFSYLEEIQNELFILRNKLRQPLKVAIIGEVKSGKSTLLNSFAGGKISPTDVTETTACIMKIAYSDKNKAIFYFKDGRKIDGSIEEIYKLLSEHHNEQQFFSECDHVEVFKPLDGLREIEIIDTPGLATITSSNEETTKKYFQNVDVVLWVFNAHYLGQSDVNNEMRNIAAMGKPIVAVINRIDEIDGDPDDLLEYVDYNLGIYLKNCFAISAYQAFCGIEKSDMNMLETSGFLDLQRYLIEKIERNSEAVLLESIMASVEVLEKKIMFIHEEVFKAIKLKIQGFHDIYREINRRGERMQERYLNNVEAWIFNIYLEDVSNAFISRVDSIGMFSNADFDEIQSNMEHDVYEASDKEIRAYLDNLGQQIENEWRESLSDIDKSLSEVFRDAREASSINGVKLVHSFSNDVSGNDVMTDSIITAGTIGGGLAFYSAVIGPAAAYVSIGSALGAIMPPVLIAGALVGGVQGLLKQKKEKNRIKSMINQMINAYRQNLSQRLLPDIESALNALCLKTRDKALEDYIKQNFNGNSLEDIQDLSSALQVFLNVNSFDSIPQISRKIY